MNYPAVFLSLLVLLSFLVLSCIPAASAAGVSLSTPQSEYYFLTGEEAAIPVTLVSTYDHDITGTLKQVLVPVNAGNAGSGSESTSIHDRAFSAFTEPRTVFLPLGRLDIPADYQLTVVFTYQEDGGRFSTLGGIGVHFVTDLENTPRTSKTLASTDSAHGAAGTLNAPSSRQEAPAVRSPATQLQNNQMQQDMSALRNQLAKESNLSRKAEDELLDFIRADPLVIPIDRELRESGFAPGTADLLSDSNQSGTFVLKYSSGATLVIVRGVVRETHVWFAEEIADPPVHLPGALLNNTTYQQYVNRSGETGFIPHGSRINTTPERKTVDLVFSNTKSRSVHLNAEIRNGSVTAVDGEDPEDPSGSLIPLIGAISIILLSAGIWYFARHRPVDLPVTGNTAREPDSFLTPRERALNLLAEAEQDAANKAWPEAYRKTGRALRVFISHESGSGAELTCGELECLVGSCSGDTEQIRAILDRCRYVGFAKGTPRAGEFPEILCSVREILSG